jgi:hypothetical protein
MKRETLAASPATSSQADESEKPRRPAGFHRRRMHMAAKAFAE